jgi:hypothetical protein
MVKFRIVKTQINTDGIAEFDEQAFNLELFKKGLQVVKFVSMNVENNLLSQVYQVKEISGEKKEPLPGIIFTKTPFEL